MSLLSFTFLLCRFTGHKQAQGEPKIKLDERESHGCNNTKFDGSFPLHSTLSTRKEPHFDHVKISAVYLSDNAELRNPSM